MDIFMDLTKAFDTIDHGILLEKFNYYGIRGTSLGWLKIYLTNRTQYVCNVNINSKILPITHGVPQGVNIETSPFYY